MHIIEIAPLENGGHRNQNGALTVPEGWAVIPADMVLPETFPFVKLTVAYPETEASEEAAEAPETAPWAWVTGMEPGEVPEASERPPEATQLDRIEAQAMYTALMTDTLLEED